MEMIKDVDDFIAYAGIYRLDGTVIGQGDEFELESVLFDPDQAQAFRSKFPTRHIWTLTSGDEGDSLQSGTRFINRIGYMFTEIDPNDSRLDDFNSGDAIILTWWESELAEASNG